MSGWSVVGQSEILAVHAAMLQSGHILYFSGSEYNSDYLKAMEFDHTRLYDCATGAVTQVGSPPRDLFCCGHALLPNGRLLVAGGTDNQPTFDGHHLGHWPGIRDAWVFDYVTRNWVAI
jgi:hypothetical protein